MLLERDRGSPVPNAAPAGNRTVASVRVREEQRQLRRLEFASKLEATTLIALVGVAVPLKHAAGLPQAASAMGPVHGLAFLFYLWTVIQTVAAGGWRLADILRLVGAAFVPLAGFLNLAWLRRRREAIAQAG